MQLPDELKPRYKPQQWLGAGAAATVVLAQDTELNRAVAIKLLHGSGLVASKDRFLEEAKVLASIRHRHIVEVFDFGFLSEGAYLVLEYLPGGSLLAELGDGSLPTPRCKTVCLAVLDALEHIHSLGIMHRDVKPANVLLDAAGVPKLADFGLVKHAESSVKTATGLMVGTVEYLAPEVFRGDSIGPLADLYAWGCLLYHLTTGRFLRSGSMHEILQNLGQLELPEDAQKSPFRAVLASALHPEPSQRGSHAQLRKRLQAVSVSSLAAAQRPTTLVTKRIATKPHRPKRSRWPWIALAFLGVSMGFSYFAFFPREISHAPPKLLGAKSLLLEWTSRLKQLDLKQWVRKLHAPTYGRPPKELERYFEGQAYPDGERHQNAMAWVRLGAKGVGLKSETARPNLDALQSLIPTLPYLDRFQKRRSALLEALKQPQVSYEIRLGFYRSLQTLASLDAYITAWGLPPVYETEALRQAFVKTKRKYMYPAASVSLSMEKLAGFQRPTVKEPVLSSGEPPSQGENLLYHWALDTKRKMPFLVQDPMRLSGAQTMGIGALATLNINLMDNPAIHYGPIKLRVFLGPRPSQRYQSLQLKITLGNLLPPDALRIDWGDLRIYHRADLTRSGRAGWVMTELPEYDLFIDLPRESWEKGMRRLILRAASLPGLNPRQGVDIFRVVLIAEEK